MSGGKPPSPPLPLGPLLGFLPSNEKAAAEACEVTPETIRRWRAGAVTTITRPVADRIACSRLGVHPRCIWLDDWW